MWLLKYFFFAQDKPDLKDFRSFWRSVRRGRACFSEGAALASPMRPSHSSQGLRNGFVHPERFLPPWPRSRGRGMCHRWIWGHRGRPGARCLAQPCSQPPAGASDLKKGEFPHSHPARPKGCVAPHQGANWDTRGGDKAAHGDKFAVSPQPIPALGSCPASRNLLAPSQAPAPAGVGLGLCQECAECVGA